MNQIVKFGPRSFGHINQFLKENNPKSIFLVTGKNSYLSSGAKTKIDETLKEYKYFRFYDFEENPKLEDVEKGVEEFRKNKCDLIIAIGGGSTIDMGKLVCFFNKKEKPYTSALREVLKREDATPIIAIPTTAGAGSEATHFAVLYVNKIKHSIADFNLLPNYVILDYGLLKSQSQSQIIISGLDALCQGIESYWSVNSNKESLVYSRKAISYCWNYLKLAADGEEVFEFLSKGAYYAGRAINITKTTGPHALSYGFTTNFKIQHGHAVSLFLPFFVVFHKNITAESCNDDRGVDFVINQMKKLAQELTINYDELEKEIIKFLKSLNVEINFGKLGISLKDFYHTLEKINHQRLKNNPRILTKSELGDIYNFNNRY